MDTTKLGLYVVNVLIPAVVVLEVLQQTVTHVLTPPEIYLRIRVRAIMDSMMME